MMKCSGTLGFAALALFSSAATLVAQSSPQISPQAVTAPDDRTITIDVQVTDSLDHPVRGLEAHDFTLTDNRESARIVDVHESGSPTPPADPVRIVIVLDMINSGFQVVARERAQLTQFFKRDGGHLSHPTSVATFSEKGANIDKVISTDGNLLIERLNKIPTVPRTEDARSGFYGSNDQMRWSLGELSQLAQVEAAAPGRKLILVLSPGWPFMERTNIDASPQERQWIFNSIEALTNGLRNAHIALYALDPSPGVLRNPLYYKSHVKAVSRVQNAEYADLALQVLAEHSGGLAEAIGSDLQAKIETAFRDADGSYSLTFEAPATTGPNEYRELNLLVDKPGSTVRTVAGYYANVHP